MTYRLIALLAAAVLCLGLTVYVMRMQSQVEALETQARTMRAENAILNKKITTDAQAALKDEARANAAEDALKTFEERADREIADLRNPSRLCLDRDDTDRVRAIFRNPLR